MDMVHNTLQLTIDKQLLYAEYWQPENPKATVVLLHGMGEHLGRYKAFVIPKLIANNYAVLAYDQIGHGKTVGKRGHVASYQMLLDCLNKAAIETKKRNPNLPVFLYGHSMGGNVVLNYALKYQSQIKGVVATSPLLRLAFNPPKWKVALGRFMLHILPGITLPSELDASGISRDKAEVARYQKDPLIHDKISPMYSFPVFDAGEYAIANADKLNIPTLVCHGTGDKITSWEASKAFTENTKKAELKLFEEGYHELHYDFCKEELMESIIAWLDAKLINEII